jgi:hypothetical protein
VSIRNRGIRHLCKRCKGGDVEYMALIYADDERWAGLSDEERAELRDRYGAFTKEAQDAGVMVGGSELSATRDATTVRVRDQETLVTDGPYAEVKEALGGYYLFECASIRDALDWAARIPGARLGSIEVRPVYSDPADAEMRP